MERRYYTLDVFTTTRFEGNPLAVITDGDGLSDDAMLAVAREMNLSETVFVQKGCRVSPRKVEQESTGNCAWFDGKRFRSQARA